MTSSRSEFEKEILEKISADPELRERIEAVPDAVAETVQSFTPVLTGETVASIEVKSRRSPWKRLSYRRIKVGTVLSESDPKRVAAIEYGRSETDDNGGTPAAAMFRRAAAAWMDFRL
jgi:hypothetical protein